MIKNMTVLLPHLEKSDDSTRAGCRLVLNGCFITVSDRCREHPAAVQACCRGASSKPTKRDSKTGIHWCAIFSEYQPSSLTFYGKYWFYLLERMSHQYLAQSGVTKMPQTGEEAIYNQIPSCKQKRLWWFIKSFIGGVKPPAIRTTEGLAKPQQCVVVMN